MFNRALTLTRHLVPTAAQGPDMEFEWDEDKRLKVLEKHGIDFWRATELFEINHVILPARSEQELRWTAVGLLQESWVAVIFTLRGDRTRLITARRARDHEQRAYRSIYN